MAKTAQNLAIITPISRDLWTNHPQNDEEKPWHRLENEPPRWYLRFRIYTLLGPKRSLQAAVAAERMQPPASKSTRKDGAYFENFLVPVLAAKVDEVKEHAKRTVEVPGTWRQASSHYRWVERSRAYDLAAFEERRRVLQAAVSDAEFADGAKRILVLDELAQAVYAHLQNHEMLTLRESLSCTSRLQSLMRDISHEISRWEREP